jgi:hypothetical protein
MNTHARVAPTMRAHAAIRSVVPHGGPPEPECLRTVGASRRSCRQPEIIGDPALRSSVRPAAVACDGRLVRRHDTARTGLPAGRNATPSGEVAVHGITIGALC